MLSLPKKFDWPGETELGEGVKNPIYSGCFTINDPLGI